MLDGPWASGQDEGQAGRQPAEAWVGRSLPVRSEANMTSALLQMTWQGPERPSVRHSPLVKARRSSKLRNKVCTWSPAAHCAQPGRGRARGSAHTGVRVAESRCRRRRVASVASDSVPHGRQPPGPRPRDSPGNSPFASHLKPPQHC